jgi:hypothetical protein
MANGLQPLAELCMDGCFANFAAFRCESTNVSYLLNEL